MSVKEKRTLRSTVIYDPLAKKFVQKGHIVRGEKVISGAVATCPNCSTEFPKMRIDQRFCCPACHAEWWLKQKHNGENPDYGMANCVICGNEFQKTRPWSKYCTDKCRSKSRSSRATRTNQRQGCEAL